MTLLFDSRMKDTTMPPLLFIAEFVYQKNKTKKYKKTKTKNMLMELMRYTFYGNLYGRG